MLNLFKSAIKKDSGSKTEDINNVDAFLGKTEQKVEPTPTEDGEEELVIKDLDKERAEAAAKSVPTDDANVEAPVLSSTVDSGAEPVEENQSSFEPEQEPPVEPIDLEKPLPDLVQDGLRIDDEEDISTPPAEEEPEDWAPNNLDEEPLSPAPEDDPELGVTGSPIEPSEDVDLDDFEPRNLDEELRTPASEADAGLDEVPLTPDDIPGEEDGAENMDDLPLTPAADELSNYDGEGEAEQASDVGSTYQDDESMNPYGDELGEETNLEPHEGDDQEMHSGEEDFDPEFDGTQPHTPDSSGASGEVDADGNILNPEAEGLEEHYDGEGYGESLPDDDPDGGLGEEMGPDDSALQDDHSDGFSDNPDAQNPPLDEAVDGEEQDLGLGSEDERSDAGEHSEMDDLESGSQTNFDDTKSISDTEKPLSKPGRDWTQEQMKHFKVQVRSSTDIFDILAKRGVISRERLSEYVVKTLKFCLTDQKFLNGKKHADVFTESAGTPVGPFLAFLALTVQSMNAVEGRAHKAAKKTPEDEDEDQKSPSPKDEESEEGSDWDEFEDDDDLEAPPSHLTPPQPKDSAPLTPRPQIPLPNATRVPTNILVVMFLQAILETSRVSLSGPANAYLEWTFIPQKLEINSKDVDCKDENSGSLHMKQTKKATEDTESWGDANPLEYVSIGTQPMYSKQVYLHSGNAKAQQAAHMISMVCERLRESKQMLSEYDRTTIVIQSRATSVIFSYAVFSNEYIKHYQLEEGQASTFNDEMDAIEIKTEPELIIYESEPYDLSKTDEALEAAELSLAMVEFLQRNGPLLSSQVLKDHDVIESKAKRASLAAFDGSDKPFPIKINPSSNVESIVEGDEKAGSEPSTPVATDRRVYDSAGESASEDEAELSDHENDEPEDKEADLEKDVKDEDVAGSLHSDAGSNVNDDQASNADEDRELESQEGRDSQAGSLAEEISHLEDGSHLDQGSQIDDEAEFGSQDEAGSQIEADDRSQAESLDDEYPEGGNPDEEYESGDENRRSLGVDREGSIYDEEDQDRSQADSEYDQDELDDGQSQDLDAEVEYDENGSIIRGEDFDGEDAQDYSDGQEPLDEDYDSQAELDGENDSQAGPGDEYDSQAEMNDEYDSQAVLEENQEQQFTDQELDDEQSLDQDELEDSSQVDEYAGGSQAESDAEQAVQSDEYEDAESGLEDLEDQDLEDVEDGERELDDGEYSQDEVSQQGSYIEGELDEELRSPYSVNSEEAREIEEAQRLENEGYVSGQSPLDEEFQDPEEAEYSEDGQQDDASQGTIRGDQSLSLDQEEYDSQGEYESQEEYHSQEEDLEDEVSGEGELRGAEFSDQEQGEELEEDYQESIANSQAPSVEGEGLESAGEFDEAADGEEFVGDEQDAYSQEGDELEGSDLGPDDVEENAENESLVEDDRNFDEPDYEGDGYGPMEGEEYPEADDQDAYSDAGEDSRSIGVDGDDQGSVDDLDEFDDQTPPVEDSSKQILPDQGFEFQFGEPAAEATEDPTSEGEGEVATFMADGGEGFDQDPEEEEVYSDEGEQYEDQQDEGPYEDEIEDENDPAVEDENNDEYLSDGGDGGEEYADEQPPFTPSQQIFSPTKSIAGSTFEGPDDLSEVGDGEMAGFVLDKETGEYHPLEDEDAQDDTQLEADEMYEGDSASDPAMDSPKENFGDQPAEADPQPNLYDGGEYGGEDYDEYYHPQPEEKEVEDDYEEHQNEQKQEPEEPEEQWPEPEPTPQEDPSSKPVKETPPTPTPPTPPAPVPAESPPSTTPAPSHHATNSSASEVELSSDYQLSSGKYGEEAPPPLVVPQYIPPALPSSSLPGVPSPKAAVAEIPSAAPQQPASLPSLPQPMRAPPPSALPPPTAPPSRPIPTPPKTAGLPGRPGVGLKPGGGVRDSQSPATLGFDYAKAAREAAEKEAIPKMPKVAAYEANLI